MSSGQLPLLFRLLVVVGRYARWVLPLGLISALLLPSIASVMQAAIGPLLALLLLVSFLQIRPQHSPAHWLIELKQVGLLLICLQLILPLCLLLIMRLLSVPDHWQVPAVLVACASCITGGPSIVMMLNGNGAKAIRLLVASTLALPITSLPVLALLPLHSSAGLLVRTAIVLALVILGAFVLAKVLRKTVLGDYSQRQRQCFDGLAAILLALVVLGLMSAIHSAWDTPLLLLATLFWACAVNIGFQCFGVLLNHLFSLKLPIMLGVMGGNRAVAIFLTALPESTYQPFLLFIACYQIPMYLTPLVGGYVYRRTSDYGN